MRDHTPCLRIDPQALPSFVRDEAERRIDAINALTEELTGTSFRHEPANEELTDLHDEFAKLVGLTPEHPDERPVAFRCDCGAYRLVSSTTRTRQVWNPDTETNEPSPVCDCPRNTTATLSPRTELFLTAIHAEAAARNAQDSDRQAVLAELADDARWAARHCDPGGPWDRSNVNVRLILQCFAQRAAAAISPAG